MEKNIESVIYILFVLFSFFGSFWLFMTYVYDDEKEKKNDFT